MKRGVMHSKETREKMRKSAMGNTHGFQTGRPSVFKGKERPNLRGENHWNWKGGTSPQAKIFKAKIEYRLWREAVFARDNWTCQRCEIRGKKELHPHHIQNFAQYPELRTSIENGITLCIDCHRGFHRIYGQKDNTKEQLEKFLVDRMQLVIES